MNLASHCLFFFFFKMFGRLKHMESSDVPMQFNIYFLVKPLKIMTVNSKVERAKEA